MLKVRFTLLLVTVALCGTFSFANNPVVGVDPQYYFTFTMGGNAGSALLNTTDLGAGQFLVTGGTLDVTAGADTGTYSVIPGGPGTFYSPSGFFIADNVLHPASDPILDTYGLLFGNGSLEINIWGNNGPGSYTFYDNTGYNASGSTVTATAVPEPASLLLLGTGLLGAAGVIRRKINL